MAPAGAWLELSVVADVEAVEAVSEILGRYAPGRHVRGTGLRPRGRGPRGTHRPDPARDGPRATSRPRIGPRRTRGRRRGARRSDTCRPSACGRSASSRPGSSTRPTGPMRGRPTSRSCASAAGSSSGRRGGATVGGPTTSCSRSIPGWRSGPACTRRPGCAWQRWRSLADRGELAGARVLDVGCGSGILAIAAVKLGAASALGVDMDPVAEEATLANARAQPRSCAGSRRARAACRAASPPFDVVLANLIAGVLVPLAGPLRDELRPGGTLLASGIFHDREAAVVERVRGGRPGGRPSGRRKATGSRWRRVAAGLSRPVALRSTAMPSTLFPILLVAHIALAICLVLPSILLPFTLRTRRATVDFGQPASSRACCTPRRTARSVIGARPGGHRAGPGRVPRVRGSSSSRGCSWPSRSTS